MKALRACLLAVAAMLVFAAACPAAQQQQPRFTPVTGDLTKRVDSYDYLIDYSGSMMMKHKQLKVDKMELIKKSLTDINSLIPALDYYAGLYTFSPYGFILKNAPWDRMGMRKAIDALQVDLDVFARTTDLGDALIAHGKVVPTEKGRKALIIVSDGEVNRGPNPIIEARNLLQANPDLCLHIISIADTEQGQATLDAIAKLKNCTAATNVGTLMKNDQAVRQFVNDVFYTEKEEKMEEVIILRGVNFAFDSDKLDATAQGILQEVAYGIQRTPSSRVMLSGYTDWFGTDKYNLGLSQRRAESVRQFLIGRGIPPSRLIAQGKGKSFTYDNNTEEGCYMNRRVEVTFIK